MRYSVVIPAYNEQEVLPESHKRLRATMDALGEPYELIFVNDGSRDETPGILARLAQEDPHVKVINFSRNFGHQAAVSAGLDRAAGQAIVIIDADLQDPPAVIPELIEKWKQGYDVAYGQRAQRDGETFFKKVTAKTYYRLLNRLTEGRIPVDTGDFRLIDRKVAEVMRAMPEHNRFLRGMVSWVGFKQTPVLYHREERFAGETKYPLKKMLKLAFDGITAFSFSPLSYPTKLGGGVVGGGLVYLLVLVILAIAGRAPAGWNWAVAALVCLNGLVLLMMGVQGQYIGRIFEETRGRPLYIVGETIGFEEENER